MVTNDSSGKFIDKIKGRDYSEEISGMSQMRGTQFTGMDNSKSYVKSERPSKGGSKKSSNFKYTEEIWLDWFYLNILYCLNS